MTHRHRWVKGKGPAILPNAYGCRCGQWTVNPERFPTDPTPPVDRAEPVRTSRDVARGES